MRLFEDGFLYACIRGSDSSSCRHSASLLLATTDADLQVEVAGAHLRGGALAVRPCTAKRLRAPGVPFVCVEVSMGHPLFRSYAAIPAPGVVVLPRDHFAPLGPTLDAFANGAMNGKTSRALYERALQTASTLLPSPRPPDPRVQRVIALLQQDLQLGVAQLASAVCLSRDRLSHLFSQEMGMSLRKYTQALKIREAAALYNTGLSLTEIAAAAGFADSSHFSKSWAQAYGNSPAYFFTSGAMAIYPSAPTAGVDASASSRFRSRNAANSHERMPTTKV